MLQQLVTWALPELEDGAVIACRCTTLIYHYPWSYELLLKHWPAVVSIRRQVEAQLNDPARN
jgi:hypothetical protein